MGIRVTTPQGSEGQEGPKVTAKVVGGPYTAIFDKLERAQRRATKMVTDLETKSCEETLKGLSMFRLEMTER